MRLLLAQEGLTEIDARHDEQAFGSWSIDLEHTPPLRVLWDGKEGWALIQWKTDKTWQGLPVWDDLWVERNGDDASPEALRRAMRSAVAFAQSAAGRQR